MMLFRIELFGLIMCICDFFHLSIPQKWKWHLRFFFTSLYRFVPSGWHYSNIPTVVKQISLWYGNGDIACFMSLSLYMIPWLTSLAQASIFILCFFGHFSIELHHSSEWRVHFCWISVRWMVFDVLLVFSNIWLFTYVVQLCTCRLNWGSFSPNSQKLSTKQIQP